MAGQDNVTLGLPRRLFEEGREPIATKSINYRSKTELLTRLKVFLGQELWDEIKGSPIGVVPRLHDLNFIWCSRIVHNMLTRQLVSKKKYELWFLLSGKPVRFTLAAYEEITGLNCVGAEDAETIEGNTSEFMRKLRVPDYKSSPTLEDLRSALSIGDIRVREDKIRVAYLMVVASVIMGLDRRSPIPLQYVKLVSDLQRFEAYPWGKVGMRYLVAEAKKTDYTTHSYYMGGFLQVIQVWAYMLIPKLGEDFGFKFTEDAVPLLRYKGSKGKTVSNTLGIIDVSRQGFGDKVSEWDDEVKDEYIDNLFEYYRKNNSFARITWTAVTARERAVRAPSGKGKKRKGDEMEGEDSCGEKVGRRVGPGGGGVLDEEWKRAMEERMERIEGFMRAMADAFRAIGMHADSRGTGGVRTSERTPPKRTPPPKPARKQPNRQPKCVKTPESVPKNKPVTETETEKDPSSEKGPSPHKEPQSEHMEDGTMDERGVDGVDSDHGGLKETDTETGHETEPETGTEGDQLNRPFTRSRSQVPRIPNSEKDKILKKKKVVKFKF